MLVVLTKSMVIYSTRVPNIFIHYFGFTLSFITAYIITLGVSTQSSERVLLDHSYAKPWSSHPDASNAKPVRLLFMKPHPRGAGEKTGISGTASR